MADTKISALPAATTPLAGTEVLPIVQGGVTEKVAVDDLTVKNVRSNATSGILQVTGPGAGTTRVATVPDANFTVARTDAAQSFTGNQTLSTGNLIIGTSGKGIDFSATPGTGTSELLADYEEGAWTPVYTSSGATFTYAVQAGWYRKVGTLVTVGFALQASASGTVTNSIFIGGLPFASQNTANTYGSVATGYTTFTEAATGQVGANDSVISMYRDNNTGNSATPTTTGIDLGDKYWIGTMSYQSV
jgi:hypothetical protein